MDPDAEWALEFLLQLAAEVKSTSDAWKPMIRII